MQAKQFFAAAAVLGGALTVARALGRRRKRIEFQGRVAIVSGGSRGLGLVLARELVHEGADVAIVARTAEDLECAGEQLRDLGGRAPLTIVADVARPGAMREVVAQVMDRFGRVDLLFNVAGTMLVAPLEHLDAADFERAMDIHFWAPLRAIDAVEPVMRSQGGGRIVNISSIGGRVSIPHLLPYCASKFALTGLSNGLGAELSRHGIWVTTVVPGLMRTGSHINVDIKGRHREEFTWFALGASLPLISMSAPRAARKILRAARYGDRRLTLGVPAKLLIAADTLASGLTADLIAVVARLLPSPAGDEGDIARSGWSSQSRWAPSPVTWRGDRAIETNNQLRGHSPSDLAAAS